MKEYDEDYIYNIFFSLKVENLFQIEENSKIILIPINYDEILIGVRNDTNYVESGESSCVKINFDNFDTKILNNFINKNKILKQFEINQYIYCDTNS